MTLDSRYRSHFFSRFQIPAREGHRNVFSILAELGFLYMPWAYWMSDNAFLGLQGFCFIRFHFQSTMEALQMVFDVINNQLCCCPPFFAGGSPYELTMLHGILCSLVYENVWIVVDAINQCNELAFKFSRSYQEQHCLARKFGKKFAVGFDCCVAVLDCILNCSEKPTCQYCTQATCEETKCYGGWKKTFGLNMTATGDYAPWKGCSI